MIIIYRRVNSSLFLASTSSIASRIKAAYKQQLYFQPSGSLSQKRKTFDAKMDKVFEILKCRCIITACNKSVCGDKCKWGAHVKFSCPKQERIPKAELKFFFSQRQRGASAPMYQIGPLDKKTTKTFQKIAHKKVKKYDMILQILLSFKLGLTLISF